MRKLFSYFFFLSCVDIFSQIITKEEGNKTLIVFAVYTLTIFLLQFIFLFYVSEKYFKKKLHIFILSFLIIFNIFSLKFNYYKFILSNSNIINLIFFIILIFILNAILDYAKNKKNIIKIIYIATLPLVLMPIIIFFFDINSFLKSSSNSSVKERIIWEASGGGYKKFQEFKKIKFNKTPDIYIISFDSLTSEDYAKKYFNLEIDYKKTIQKIDGRIFENSFVPEVPSTNSLNGFLMLDQKNYSNDKDRFSGNKNSILFQIMKNNNYKTLTGYSGNYFGRVKGKFVDEYKNETTIEDSLICLQGNTYSAFFISTHFGVCNKYILNFFGVNKKEIVNSHETMHGDEKLMREDWYKKVIDQIYEKNNDKSPWVTFHYIYRPIGHTPGDFKFAEKKMWDEYINDDFKPGMKKVSEIINELNDKLKNSKKEYIILIFGDHGPWLSRDLKNKKGKPEEHKKFFIYDRHSVFTATYGTNNCSKDFNPIYTQSNDTNQINININEKEIKNSKKNKDYFTSPSRVMTGIIDCLSSQDLKISKIAEFSDYINFSDYLK